MADFHGSFESEDFQEEQVWDIMNTIEEVTSNSKSRGKNIDFPSSEWRFTGTPTTIPRANSGGVSHHKLSASHHSSSAPVKINQDWSNKILKRNLWDDDDVDVISDDVISDDDDVVPPHEYLARRFASNKQIASYSMCEGIGRTLKGRDLSNLRNAILTKTGFLE